MTASETNPASPPVSLPSQKRVPGAAIPYERFLDCVHCGLCTSACPTYVETGDENDSPRGRIYLMRSVVDGRLELTDKVRGHLDLCLDCRSCETACPSGVQYGRLLEPFRVDMQNLAETASSGSADASRNLPQADSLSRSQAVSKPDWFHRWVMYGLFPHRGRMSWALWPARMLQTLKLDRLMNVTGINSLLPQRLRRMQQQLPQLKPAEPTLPVFLPAKGERRASVGLFLGCVADAMFRHVHWATARVLQENGCDVYIPGSQNCCGAIHYHSGAVQPAIELMKQNSEAFPLDALDAIVVNVAGCGAMLKDYHHIAEETLAAEKIPSQVAAFTGKVRDISEFLMQLGLKEPTGPVDAIVAYQDACHLQHAQRIRQQPRDLLQMIPGITLRAVAEPELCCGAAGSYNLTQPDMADRLGRRRIQHLLDVQPDLIVSANAGCSLQLQAQLRSLGRDVPVVHPLELLDLSYRNAGLDQLA
ncbi:MAG: 4Fe-4S dicluster domain-containing protein [Planctomycetaceae bacterium]|nr:4Fe-4S dicluster domain-containing protein [Planctomycetaceae bacterium]